MIRSLLLILLMMFSTLLRAEDPAEKPVPGQGLFVAVGYGGFRGWSVDGQNWTGERWSDKNADDKNVIFTLIYRAGIFYAAGGGGGGPFGPSKGFILRSTDGKHWDEVATAKFRISALIDLGDRLLSAYDDKFYTSMDGITWKPAADAKLILPNEGTGWQSGYYRRWTYGNGAAVFAGDYALPGGKPRVGWIGGTKNGETPLVMTREDADVCGLAFGNGHFVACTKDGAIILSNDGLQFKTSGTSGDKHDGDAVRFHEGLFYLRGKKGVQTSPDGEKWTAAANPPRIPRAVSPTGIAVDCGWNGITVAPDGKKYQKATVNVDATGINAIVYGVPLANLTKDEAKKKP